MRYVVEGINYNEIEPERFILDNKKQLVAWYNDHGYKYSETRSITVPALRRYDLEMRPLNE